MIINRRFNMFAAVKNYLIAFAVALVIFGITGYYLKPILVDDLVSGFLSPGSNPVQTEENTEKEEDTSPDTSLDHVGTDEPGPEEPKLDGDSFTLLIVGSDYQPGVFNDYRCNTNSTDIEVLAQNQRRYGADVITVIRANTETGVLMVSSVPSTLAVTVSGVDMKLYDVLERKGMSYFARTVEAIIGLPIDYYMECRISDFINVIDYMGGIKFNVPVNMYYVDEEERIVLDGASRDPIPVVDENGNPMYDENGEPITVPAGTPFTIDLKAGIQELTGETASHLLRYAGYSDGAKSRCTVQTDFIHSFLEQYAKPENKMKLATMLTKIPSQQKELSVTEAEDVISVLVQYSEFEKVKLTFPATYTAGGASYSQAAVYSAFNPYKNK